MTAEAAIAIAWFRRDLRLHDHPALWAALEAADRVLCLYVLDDRLFRGRFSSPARVDFLLRSLAELAESVHERGGALVVRRGPPDREVPAVAREFGAGAVFVSRDYAPFGRRRDARVAAALARAGVVWVEAPGVLATEPEQIVKANGEGFSVFGAFFRRWQALEPRAVLPAPSSLEGPRRRAPPVVPSLADLGLPPHAASLLPAGEHAARARLAAWAADGLSSYAPLRDRLDIEGTSRLSQDLRWGLLSPVEVLSRLHGPGRARFAQELAWRDFYYHLAYRTPSVLREPFRPNFALLPWSHEPAALQAWQSGRTGYPVVDAAMRQLVSLGWMHNRARMIVASFLTKHLLIDYREGERFFMRHLVDGDPAVNNGGWQWAASTGTDPQPYFRVFNPVLQGQRFDPEGAFVRGWLPELAGVPLRYLHQPWTMPPDVQRASRCLIGRDYPAPIVPQEGAADRARAFFASARSR